ncbi:hypothetical protein DU500_13395 [Haloplanus rubicundus]|uniref:Uncharacterized protein n=1 Tax=Haloplanus rubicundus TaxID=1547898 RepID=A0A345EEX2_9EURY|nr:hypothetical protein [Haloplanus rubicundus]AXG07337.1 hypothetical protein DU500_13395 [Haloplanus rubicundus]AXG10744.1 hypothetical protein DU484_13320 [Haloplanus rubicundus]
MPQLRSCYFCGSVGDSLREYEVVPERLVASGESRSAVLCSDCREKLRRVLEPLVEAAESSAGGGPEPGTAAIGEVTFESGDATPDDEAATDGRDGDDDETVTVTERDADGDGSGTDDSESGTNESDVPDGYHKVLRLLQNREFPMERADLTALVTGAYDVSEPQCERILETAIERGVLVEDGSTLDIGRN